MALYEIAVLVVHYLLAVALVSCALFSLVVGTMTGGQYYAVQAKYMKCYCNNGLIMESLTVLCAGGLTAEEANVSGVIVVVKSLLNTDVFPKQDQWVETVPLGYLMHGQ
jgi:hypothetical protein